MTFQILIQNEPKIHITGIDVGSVSDGYHTFDELYEHRCILWMVLCAAINDRAESDASRPWRSERHSDDSSWDGWFILGHGEWEGEQITYHIPMKYWDQCSFARIMDRAPTWDGHTSADVLERLKKYLP